ncbi:hypothetical protein NPIL_172881 [Nephila pilipes]|uniref:Myosin tail domain-containing protein n=1 Tax=Nephila pilipes TaxID=299642 RepID=A0A8X6UI21_NEPPI|nr:hypothetical protein NPIL_172881 [Nephila pilipes]
MNCEKKLTASRSYILQNEKGRLVAHLPHLEEELEEEQSNSEILVKKARKAQEHIKQFTNDLASEGSNSHELENNIMNGKKSASYELGVSSSQMGFDPMTFSSHGIFLTNSLSFESITEYQQRSSLVQEERSVFTMKGNFRGNFSR